MRISRPILSALTAASLGSAPMAYAKDKGSPNANLKATTSAASGSAVPDAPLAVPGPNPAELVYTPIKICRVFGQQDLAYRATKVLQITGAASLVAQGGPAAGCGIPASARAVAINLSASSGFTGSLTAFPAGETLTYLASLSYRTGTVDTAGSTVGLNASGQMAVYSSQAARIYGDVTGYYAPQIHATLNYNGGILQGSPRVLESVRLGVGSYRVSIDRTPTGCTPIASIFGSAYFASAYVSGQYIYANTYAPSGAATDLYWTLMVMC